MGTGGSHLSKNSGKKSSSTARRSTYSTETAATERRSTRSTETAAAERRSTRSTETAAAERRSTRSTETAAERRSTRSTEAASAEQRRSTRSTEAAAAERRSTRSTEAASAERRASAQTVRRSSDAVRVDAPAVKKSGTARKKKRRKGGVPSWLILVLLIAGMLFAGFMLTKTIISYRKNRASYDALRDIAVVQLTPGPRTVLKETAEGTVEEVIQSEVPISVDWDALRATNSDIIGWLYCPDTVINYPVVRATDNEKYLTTNFEGSYNAGGALFADYGSSVGFRSSHLIIYGHNMKDNSMFGTLKSYGDPKYFEQHPVFYFLTPDQAYRVDLLEAATIDATLDNYPTYFGEGETLESYVGRISRNVYWFNDQADYQNNQLMTMSTCTSSDAQRLIVQGVMVPIE